MNYQSQVDLLRFQLRKKEATAKAVPYISFILTHAALVLFLVLTFFIDSLIGPTMYSLAIKITLAVLAVLLLASEWIFAIVTSQRWKKDILLLLQLEEEQRHYEEQQKIKKQEELIAAEQLRNRVLQADLQRQRNHMGSQGRNYTPRSVRPERSSAPLPPMPSFSPNGNDPQYAFPPLDSSAIRHPFRQS
ncbi:MAG TPA: hypothetical protein VGD98_19650 [Ktedonobacteraceae bacterium]